MFNPKAKILILFLLSILFESIFIQATGVVEIAPGVFGDRYCLWDPVQPKEFNKYIPVLGAEIAGKQIVAGKEVKRLGPENLLEEFWAWEAYITASQLDLLIKKFPTVRVCSNLPEDR